MDATRLLAKLIARQDLAADEARPLFDALVDHQLEPPLVAAILATLAAKGETVAEIVAAAETLRRRAVPVRAPSGVDAIDTCGTGGDGKPLINVSTAVALVAAAAGATVAKHGNRSNARPSGSAEVLAALGVNIDADVPVVERCLAECRVAFLYAVRLHPAMRHAAGVRRALSVRTIFNLVGPLANPAGVRRQLVGVNRPDLVVTLLEALRQLGATRAMVVHGLGGLCDIDISGRTRISRWDGSRVQTEEIDCGVIGATPAPLAALHIRSSTESAHAIRNVLSGKPGPALDIVVLNTAAALWVAGIASDWKGGAELARQAIESGSAQQTLVDLVRISNEPAS